MLFDRSTHRSPSVEALEIYFKENVLRTVNEYRILIGTVQNR